MTQGWISVPGYHIEALVGELPRDVVALFTAAELQPEEQDGERRMTLCAPAAAVKRRLELFGVGRTPVQEAFEMSRDAYVALHADMATRQTDPAERTAFEGLAQEAAALTMDAWCEQMRANRRFTLKRSARKPAYDEGCLDRMTIGMPWHGGLWLILNTCDPQDELTVDVTDFLDAQLVSAAELNHDSAIQPFLNSATRYAPVIVLTEGRTDVEVLSGACALLFPELTEYVRFFDFAVRPEGGATMLTTLVRSFAASHIVNRVVAVYDNDAAGRAEYDKLVASATPANIRVIHYPSLEAHREYPTTEGHPIDAGGFGASIELYLGTDVLAPDECGPLPLRRTGGHDGGRRQWSLRRADKEKAMKRFRAKVNAAHEQGLQPGQDWSGLTSILQAIFSAFADEAVSGFPEVRPSLVREASYIQPFG